MYTRVRASSACQYEWHLLSDLVADRPDILPMPTRTNWTRPQLLIALNLYHKVSFGMFHAKNKMLVDISRRMGRTDSALPMKLSNPGS